MANKRDASHQTDLLNPVAPGEGTYLRWNVGDPNGSISVDVGGAGNWMNTSYSGFSINDLGMTLANSGNAINLANIAGSPYDSSGKVWVAPYQTTTYTGSASFTIPDCWAYDATQQSCPAWYPSCPAILYVEGGSQSPVPAVAPAAPPPPPPPPPPLAPEQEQAGTGRNTHPDHPSHFANPALPPSPPVFANPSPATIPTEAAPPLVFAVKSCDSA